MKRAKKILIWLTAIIAVLLLLICTSLYFLQERMIFFPTKLSADHQFKFEGNYEEIVVTTKDKVKLNGLLFKSDSAKGLIFYLHGNGGCIESLGKVAPFYTGLNYDLFMLDYRGYGKSEGKITSEEQFYSDIQLVYDSMKTRYPENKIAVLGYSIGSGPSAMLASANHPRLLILQAPYYSLIDMMHQRYPGAPDLLLKYKFETFKFVKDCKAPIVIFHGNRDGVIDHTASLKLKELLKPEDKLVVLEGQEHNRFTENPEYLNELARLFPN